MRTDGVLRLILNISIFPEMNVAITGDKYIRFMGVEEGKPVSFLLKVGSHPASHQICAVVIFLDAKALRTNIFYYVVAM